MTHRQRRHNGGEQFRYVYGPVSSWRLGSSLGIDLITGGKKVCSFDCLYCQLAATIVKTRQRTLYVPVREIVGELRRLPPQLSIDYITFSGNGEPTLAKNLAEIISEVKKVRKEKTAIITNSSLMWDESVRKDIMEIDFVLAKLDASCHKTFEKINQPVAGIRFEDVYNGIKAFREEYGGRLALQIMFIESNRTEYKEIAKAAFDIDPDEIQVNTPLRPCGVQPLSKEAIFAIKEYFSKTAGELESRASIISVYDTIPKKVKPISSDDTLRRRGKVV